MKLILASKQKILITLVFFTIAVIGFMVKLPSGFRHIDKELHAGFYFLAFAFLNIIFAKKKLVRHIVIFISLFLFGIMIEFGQGYSNKFFSKRIHGRFDSEDVQWNTKGLIAFTVIWLFFLGVNLIYNKVTLNKNK